jgi:hypothetical protein
MQKVLKCAATSTCHNFPLSANLRYTMVISNKGDSDSIEVIFD